jgi:dihydrofolate reductase
MGSLVVTEFLTLDGVGQAPGGPDEDPDGGFAHGGWQQPGRDPESAALVHRQARSMDALLLGRRTYEIFAGYWPTAPPEIPFTDLLNGVPKYVASRTLTDPLSWRRSQVLAGPVASAVEELKKQHRETHVIGSLHLVQSLLRDDLVDRLELWIQPVVLGHGKRLFEGGTGPFGLTLARSVTLPSGTVHLAYERAGSPG